MSPSIFNPLFFKKKRWGLETGNHGQCKLLMGQWDDRRPLKAVAPTNDRPYLLLSMPYSRSNCFQNFFLNPPRTPTIKPPVNPPPSPSPFLSPLWWLPCHHGWATPSKNPTSPSKIFLIFSYFSIQKLLAFLSSKTGTIGHVSIATLSNEPPLLPPLFFF